MTLRKMLFAALAVGGLLAAPDTASAQTKVAFGMPTSPPNIVHMPLLIADELGFFKDAGIEIDFIPFEGGVKAYRAVVSGDVMAAMAAGAGAIIGRGQGAPTKMVVASAPKLEASMIAQGDIKSVKELKGRKLGIQQPGGFAHILSMNVMRTAGLGKDDVEFVSILSEDVPPLVAGQIDTAILHVEQEMIAKQKKSDLHALARLWEVSPMQLYSVTAVSEDSIKNNRDAVKALVKGSIWGARMLYTERDKVLPIIVKHTGLPEDVIAPSLDFLVESCIWSPGHGLSKDTVGFTTDLMVKVGNLPKEKAPSYEDNVDLSLAEEAMKELGEYNGPCKG